MSVHIGNKIKQIADQKGINITEFARQINTTRENVYKIFKRKAIDTGLLERISRVLHHDFFQYFALSLVEENKHLKEEILKLKEDVAILKEMISLLKIQVKGNVKNQAKGKKK